MTDQTGKRPYPTEPGRSLSPEHVCRLCRTVFPDMDFGVFGCQQERGPHTDEAVVLAYVLAAAVNGYRTNEEFVQAFLDDALNIIGTLGPCERWHAQQDADNCDRWTINGIAFHLDYGSTNEGGGDLTPTPPARVCPECDEDAGWAVWEINEQVQIECRGCGQDLTIDRWWMTAPASGPSGKGTYPAEREG